MVSINKYPVRSGLIVRDSVSPKISDQSWLAPKRVETIFSHTNVKLLIITPK